MARRQGQRGVAMVEFALAGVASIFLLICTFHLAMGMWNYHTIAYAVHQTTRYVSVKGSNCTIPGNNCWVSVGTIVGKFEQYAIGIPKDQVSVTLTTNSGAATVCNPVNTCESTTTMWPPSTNSDNVSPAKITVSAIYRFRSPLLFFWPSQGTVQFGEVWLPSSSSQTILF
jgi:hypothetical protein